MIIVWDWIQGKDNPAIALRTSDGHLSLFKKMDPKQLLVAAFMLYLWSAEGFSDSVPLPPALFLT